MLMFSFPLYPFLRPKKYAFGVTQPTLISEGNKTIFRFGEGEKTFTNLVVFEK